MKPYKTKPILKEKIWGTESWETDCTDGTIPLLIKFIKTDDMLSVQLHPDDDYARLAEGQPNGKAELWVVLDCAPDAAIVYGFNKKMDKNILCKLISDNKISDCLNIVKVKKGDCVFIPPGTVHTMGKDILVYEVQQPSDITYRIYDWDRTDANGNRRELHIRKAMDVVDLSTCEGIGLNIYDYLSGTNINIVQIAECRYFKCFYLNLHEKETSFLEKADFKAMSCISGSGSLIFGSEIISFQKGDTCIIPGEYDEDVCITSDAGTELIVSTCKTKS